MEVRLVKGCKDDKGLEASVLKRDWHSWGCLALKVLPMCIHTLWEGVKRKPTPLFCPVTGQEAMGMKWIQEFTFKHKENLSLGGVEHWSMLPRSGDVSVLGGRQDFIRYDPGLSAVDDPDLSRELQYWFSRDPFQPRILWSKDFEDMLIFQVSLKHTVHLYLSL